MVGANPKPVDIVSPTNPTINVKNLKPGPHTRALILAPIFGTAPTNLEEVIDFCHTNNLVLIEDAAQCMGIKSSKGHMGSFGKISTFSFYADKTITMGEGGLVVTNDDQLADRITLLRNQGRRNSGTFVHEAIGYNYRITDIQAALGLHQLRELDYIAENKQRILARYKDNFRNHTEISFLETREHDFSLIPFRCVIFTENVERILEIMSDNGVQSRAMFYPIHKQPGYKNEPWSNAEYPNADRCSATGICLPTWVQLTADEIDYVCEVTIKAIKSI